MVGGETSSWCSKGEAVFIIEAGGYACRIVTNVTLTVEECAPERVFLWGLLLSRKCCSRYLFLLDFGIGLYGRVAQLPWHGALS